MRFSGVNTGKSKTAKARRVRLRNKFAGFIRYIVDRFRLNIFNGRSTFGWTTTIYMHALGASSPEGQSRMRDRTRTGRRYRTLRADRIG